MLLFDQNTSYRLLKKTANIFSYLKQIKELQLEKFLRIKQSKITKFLQQNLSCLEISYTK